MGAPDLHPCPRGTGKLELKLEGQSRARVGDGGRRNPGGCVVHGAEGSGPFSRQGTERRRLGRPGGCWRVWRHGNSPRGWIGSSWVMATNNKVGNS
jgi:hypothetical protein